MDIGFGREVSPGVFRPDYRSPEPPDQTAFDFSNSKRGTVIRRGTCHAFPFPCEEPVGGVCRRIGIGGYFVVSWPQYGKAVQVTATANKRRRSCLVFRGGIVGSHCAGGDPFVDGQGRVFDAAQCCFVEVRSLCRSMIRRNIERLKPRPWVIARTGKTSIGALMHREYRPAFLAGDTDG